MLFSRKNDIYLTMAWREEQLTDKVYNWTLPYTNVDQKHYTVDTY